MKKKLAVSTALGAMLWAFAPFASAHEFEVAAATSYIDTGTFNARFSEQPILKLTATLDITEELYFEPYLFLDFEDGLDGESSEYGFTLGGEWQTGESSSVSLSTGRYANYNGLGGDVGDWFVKAGVDYHNFSLSGIALFGTTDEFVVDVAYDISLSESATLTPSLAYLTDAEVLNPGLAFDYAVNDTVTIGLSAVYPEVEDEFGDRSRELYGAASIAFTF